MPLPISTNTLTSPGRIRNVAGGVQGNARLIHNPDHVNQHAHGAILAVEAFLQEARELGLDQDAEAEAGASETVQEVMAQK
jgi:hypothetical protein